MARTCNLCGKKVHFGNNVSHSKQHTRRTWLPNIQKTTKVINGKTKKLYICTRCLRNQHNLAR